jgi:hypothetical protein
MYKLEEKIFFDGARHAHSAVAYFSLCAGQSTDLALIDSRAMDITPVIADINERRLEFSAHGFSRAADYLISHSGLNQAHAISRDNAGHFILNGQAGAAAFSGGHHGLFESADNHSVNVLPSGVSVVSINSLALFATAGNRNFSLAVANNDDGAFELVLNSAETNIAITVNGMMSKGSAAKLDAANAVRRFYVDSEISVNRLNINLIDGHAGTGNDGRNIANNSAFNNAIAGKKSIGGVVIYANNKNNIFEAITLRCANVSA